MPKLFSISSQAVDPLESLEEVSDVLATVIEIFCTDEVPELTPSSSTGIYRILHGCVAAINSAREAIEADESDEDSPSAVQEAITAEFARGRKMGREELLTELAEVHHKLAFDVQVALNLAEGGLIPPEPSGHSSNVVRFGESKGIAESPDHPGES